MSDFIWYSVSKVDLVQFFRLVPLELLSLPNMTFTYRNKDIIQQYPAKTIQNEYQEQIQQESNKYLLKKHTNTNIDINTSIKLTNHLPHSNFLDTRFIHEMKFRTKLLNKSLTTKTLLKKQKITPTEECPFCNETETIEHIWECQNTKDQTQTIYEKFTENLQNRHLDTKYQINPNTRTFKQIINILKLQRNQLNTHLPHTDGVVTHTITNNLKHIYKDKTTKISRTDILLTILDCWYNALYITIWIPRNQKIYNKPSKPPHSTSTPLRKQTRDPNNNNNKRKRELVKNMKRKKRDQNKQNKRKRTQETEINSQQIPFTLLIRRNQELFFTVTKRPRI